MVVVVTELVLARHGETLWHTENRYAGRSDVELAADGHRQAEALAGWAAGAGLHAVVCSPLQRAVHTATPAARAAGLPLRTDPRLVEVDFGAGDGHTREEMETLFPDALAAFLAAPASSPLPGGETGPDAVERALPVLTEAVAAGHRRVLVVAHQTLLRLLLCQLLSIPLDHYRSVFPRLEGAARTVVRPAAHGPAALVALNVPC